jgi:RNA polymerase sigma factor (sigma-70 family)
LSTTIDFYRRTIRYSSRVVSRQFSPDFSAELAQDQPDPLELLILQEQAEKQSRLNRRVQAALATLPTSQQEAIELFFNRSRSKRLKEICRESGIPYSTLRSRVTRGVNRLRLHLQDEKPPDFPGCEKVREDNP